MKRRSFYNTAEKYILKKLKKVLAHYVTSPYIMLISKRNISIFS